MTTLTFEDSSTYEDALHRACETWGVQREFWDIFGKLHIATTEVLATILKSMSVDVRTRESLDAAVEAYLWSQWSLPVQPTLVLLLSDGYLPVVFPADAAAVADVGFDWEDGTSSALVVAPGSLAVTGTATLRGAKYIRTRVPLPPSASYGYHYVSVTIGGKTNESRLILCPDRAWQPEFLSGGGKGAGIAISLYGIRSQRNWGCGDFTDLESFTTWAARQLDPGFIALNPLHAIPNRQPYNTSPYLPNCSYYRNPIYLDAERIEDVRRSSLAGRILQGALFQSKLAEVRSADYVEYEKVWTLKKTILKLGFREFLRGNPPGSERRAEFDRYLKAEGDLLHRFSVYSALDEMLHKRDRNLWIWPDWPEGYRNPDSPETAAFEREYPRLVLFFGYVQWQLDIQLAAAQEHAKSCGLPIGLYHDLALATDRCGSDLWAHPSFYIAGCRVGAPPDDFSPKGQDWAFPPPDSGQHLRSNYELFIQSIRKNSRHGGALRIDHVMRFFRLFWITDGREASDGVYVTDHADDLLRILALESVRNKVLIIGEDLGTVEPYIREALTAYGILSYRLLYFEKNKDETYRRPEQYPYGALVSVSTHDLPTLAGFWLNRDIEARRRAGVLPDEASLHEQLRSRAVEKQRMLDVMFDLRLLPDWFPRRESDVPDFTGELHNAAVGFLTETPSQLMVLNQEDLFKNTDQQNLPGTTDQYPNWRHKMRYSVEELWTDGHALACAAMFRSWLERTKRTNQTTAA